MAGGMGDSEDTLTAVQEARIKYMSGLTDGKIGRGCLDNDWKYPKSIDPLPEN